MAIGDAKDDYEASSVGLTIMRRREKKPYIKKRGMVLVYFYSIITITCTSNTALNVNSLTSIFNVGKYRSVSTYGHLRHFWNVIFFLIKITFLPILICYR